MKTVQLYNAEANVTEEFRRRNKVFYKAQNESNFYDALLFSLVEGVTTFALALVLWYAAGASLEGLVTLGVLIAFMEYIQRLFVPVRELSQQLAILQRAMAALDHIGELFVEPVDEAEAADGKKLASRSTTFEYLAFSNVGFAYSEKSPPVLRDVSFELQHGETLALVGARLGQVHDYPPVNTRIRRIHRRDTTQRKTAYSLFPRRTRPTHCRGASKRIPVSRHYR